MICGELEEGRVEGGREGGRDRGREEGREGELTSLELQQYIENS